MTDRDILTDPQWLAFQRQLDAQPDSHATRAVLADWLEGQGHPWAKAYRWMAKMERWPKSGKEVVEGWIFLGERIATEVRFCELFDTLPIVGK